MQAIVIIESGSQAGQQRWVPRGSELTIGESPFADFVIEDAGLQPIHLSVSLRNDSCELLAIGEARFEIRGVELSSSVLMADTLISVGSCVLKIVLEGIEADASASIEPNEFGHSALTDPPSYELDCFELDETFNCFQPMAQLPVNKFLERLCTRVPTFGLCEFNPWTFPKPPELESCQDCIPEPRNAAAMKRLPLLFPSEICANFTELMSAAMGSAQAMTLVSKASHEELLQFLRSAGGLYLSPASLEVVLVSGQPGASEQILGPIAGVLLGDSDQWKFIGPKVFFPDPGVFGFDFSQ